MKPNAFGPESIDKHIKELTNNKIFEHNKRMQTMREQKTKKSIYFTFSVDIYLFHFCAQHSFILRIHQMFLLLTDFTRQFIKANRFYNFVEKEELVNLVLIHVDNNFSPDSQQSPTSISMGISDQSDEDPRSNPFDQIRNTCQNLFTTFTEKIATG